MNAINETVRAIASRHVAALVLADTPRKSSASLNLTSPAARRVQTVSTTRVRRRVPATPTAAS